MRFRISRIRQQLSTAGLCSVLSLGIAAGSQITWTTEDWLSGNTTWDLSIAGPSGPLAIRGLAFAKAVADGVIGPSAGTTLGTKLSFAPATGWTDGIVSRADAATGAKGSTANGSSTVSGHWGQTIWGGWAATATSHFTGSKNPAPGGSASYEGRVDDPFSFGTDGVWQIQGDGVLTLGFAMPSWGNSLPLDSSQDGSWHASATAWVKDGLATTDANTFYSSNPQLLYAVDLFHDSTGLHVHFTPGTPGGFPLSFSANALGIESGLLNALENGWNGDMNMFMASLNLSGHQNATIGFSNWFEIDGSLPASQSPEPGSIALIGTGLVGMGCIFRRRGTASTSTSG